MSTKGNVGMFSETQQRPSPAAIHQARCKGQMVTADDVNILYSK